jgi:fatty-acyl-CoA synthase
MNAYDQLAKNPANFVALSPLSFLQRSAMVYPDQAAIIYADRQISWAQMYHRCCQFASCLAGLGIGKNDTVSVLLPNVPAMIEAHYAIPMAGAVLHTINTRLDAKSIAFMLEHAESKVLLVDPEFQDLAAAALSLVKQPIVVIDVADRQYPTPLAGLGDYEYEQLIATGDANFAWQLPADEWDAISLNYTSGTTGDPKGVVYHHRGAYLNAVSNLMACNMTAQPRYLSTLPLFHCNGWCFPWSIAITGGSHYCLRHIDTALIYQLIAQHKIEYFCCAPIVLSMLLNAPAQHKRRFSHRVEVLTAGAAPPTAIIEGMRNMGIALTHVYGLTETYGPSAMCALQPHWEQLPSTQQAALLSRQGVPYPLQQAMRVFDSQMQLVANDGSSMGEILFRGNIVMKGYLKNPEATRHAFQQGWFHTGDLAVSHPDGYAKICDRAKDIIISGGENISSLEIEEVLYRHPAVLTAAVVAKPDAKWQEVPCAFIELKAAQSLSQDEILDHCRQHLASYKLPKDIVFAEIPKTSTGKLQKFILREWAKQRLE